MGDILHTLAVMFMAWILCAFMFAMAGIPVFPFLV